MFLLLGFFHLIRISQTLKEKIYIYKLCQIRHPPKQTNKCQQQQQQQQQYERRHHFSGGLPPGV